MRCGNFVAQAMIIVDGIEFKGTKHVSVLIYKFKESGNILNGVSAVCRETTKCSYSSEQM